MKYLISGVAGIAIRPPAEGTTVELWTIDAGQWLEAPPTTVYHQLCGVSDLDCVDLATPDEAVAEVRLRANEMAAIAFAAILLDDGRGFAVRRAAARAASPMLSNATLYDRLRSRFLSAPLPVQGYHTALLATQDLQDPDGADLHRLVAGLLESQATIHYVVSAWDAAASGLARAQAISLRARVTLSGGFAAAVTALEGLRPRALENWRREHGHSFDSIDGDERIVDRWLRMLTLGDNGAFCQTWLVASIHQYIRTQSPLERVSKAILRMLTESSQLLDDEPRYVIGTICGCVLGPVLPGVLLNFAGTVASKGAVGRKCLEAVWLLRYRDLLRTGRARRLQPWRIIYRDFGDEPWHPQRGIGSEVGIQSEDGGFPHFQVVEPWNAKAIALLEAVEFDFATNYRSLVPKSVSTTSLVHADDLP